MLKITGLRVTCGNKNIIDGVDLSLGEGKILGVIGQSGCGKTTLLKSIIRLPQKGMSITSGSIEFCGTDLLTLTNADMTTIRGRQIGFIFQNAQSSFSPVRKIESQIVEMLQTHENISKKQARNQMYEMFLRMKLTDYERIATSYPFELSGGMNQRVAIAVAMLLKPKLLLADEPTSALDVVLQRSIIEEMIELCKSENTAIIIVSHNTGLLKDIVHNAVEMSDGKIKDRFTIAPPTK